MISTTRLALIVSEHFVLEGAKSTTLDLLSKYGETYGLKPKDVLLSDIIRSIVQRPNRDVVRVTGTICYNNNPVLLAYDVAQAFVGKFGLKEMYDIFINRLELWKDFIEKEPNYKETMKALFEYVLKTVERDHGFVPLDLQKESFLFEDMVKAIEEGGSLMNLERFYRDILKPYSIQPGSIKYDVYFGELLARLKGKTKL